MSESYVNTFRIGGDPEFALLNADNTICNFSRVSTEIGSDHGGAVVELRPQPSYSVKGFLENIKVLLDSPTLNAYADKRWRAGAFIATGTGNFNGLSMGGHIHIETPFSVTAGRGGIPAVAIDVFHARMDAMDHVTKMFEEIDLLPKSECVSRRERGGYGHFGYTDKRNHHEVIDPSTSIQRVEYRSPCSWLFNPRNAFLLITSLKLATVSPIATMKAIPGGSREKIFEGIVKLLRNFQHIDHDAYLAANRICRSVNPENLERLKANTEVDFKKNWAFKDGKNALKK